jgi:NAD(P)-dependent dehydrogenase (short-subunit alcohol dehydrogenase family)
MIWNSETIKSQAGKTFVVTGANAGIGFETASVLASKGAKVIMACRNPQKGDEAVRRIRLSQPHSMVQSAALDLASLASVRSFAAKFEHEHDRLDVLINNAGVMMPPFGQTMDGFETQFGTNFLGHFLLTLLLLPKLNGTQSSRVVTLSSVAHWLGHIDFDNLQAERAYSEWSAYAQSKLANLMFVYELQRRLVKTGASTISVGAHPGVTASELTRHNGVLNSVQSLIAQTTRNGAMPSLRAAIDPEVRGGDYYGPGNILSLTFFGSAKKQGSSSRSKDRSFAARLWEVAEQLTEERYPLT